MRRLDDDDLLEVLGTSGHKVQSQNKRTSRGSLKVNSPYFVMVPFVCMARYGTRPG